MTRTDFKAIAEVIREYKVSGSIDEVQLRAMVDKMCIYFQKTNITFSKMDFVRRCGWYGG